MSCVGDATVPACSLSLLSLSLSLSLSLLSFQARTTHCGWSAGHSFTQLILRPYGWVAPPTVPPNDAFAEAVGDQMAAAIEQVHGMSYTNQPSADLYPVCGCAIDYLYETTLGVTFTMELRPATSGGGGFILP